MGIAKAALLAVRSSGDRSRWRMSQAASLLIVLAPAAALLVAGLDRRWMDDDGFINLRIARNWLEGNGPVFNVDERVEASTSPLWLVLLTALGGVGFRLEYAAVFGGIILTVTGMLLAEDGALRLHPDRGGRLRLSIPIGAAIVAALPPAWDYASGGLETGLAMAWLGASYSALSRLAVPCPRLDAAGRGDLSGGSLPAHAMPWRETSVAALVGLGPLIRPEFAIYSLAFLIALASAVDRRLSASGAVRAVGVAALSAGAVPGAYLLFRMGYYAAVVPNTALAKEAFLANFSQGRCYFDNFFGTYWMGWPLAAAAPFWCARLHAHLGVRSGPRRLDGREHLALALTMAPPIAAAVHVVYLVAIGGDYMHGRLLVPAVFAGLLPVMAARAGVDHAPAEAGTSRRAPPSVRFAHAALATGGVALGLWVALCAAKLRVGVENVCNVGDERGWYARMAKVRNPVAVDAYRAHPFYDGALKWIQRVHAVCPDLPAAAVGTGPTASTVEPCRRVFTDEEKAQIAPAPAMGPMAGDVDSRVAAVVPAGAIGMLGYLLPSSVHIVDLHGLAEPLVARFELEARGRPGHEKKLSTAWLLARFSQPAPDEDAAVTAARHALGCGRLGSFEHAMTAPLTPRVFLANVASAWGFSRLRVPRDPFDAEVRFCGTAQMISRSAGGGGGTPFRWRCPRGAWLSGIRGTIKPREEAFSSVQPLCRRIGESLARDGAEVIGPAFGEPSDVLFDVGCPPGTFMSTLRGSSDNLVRSIQLLCSSAAEGGATTTVGARRGGTFSLECPHRGPIVGLQGRTGALVDATGLLCEPLAGRGGAE